MVLAATAILASGCGGDSSANSAVQVETGSLSKAEFVNQANAICNSARTQFLSEYTAFYKKNEPKGEAETLKLLEEATEKLVVPNYETRMINRIAALGAPEEVVPGVTDFVETVQQQIKEIEDDPELLTETAFPFKQSAGAAQAAGLKACANAFS
ncbi:MAG TPA: hypothetical protein VNL97_03595 [Solirubrobacterales bacterium]|nr:hypothetical protein [Solirubrobacterales bacterium]